MISLIMNVYKLQYKDAVVSYVQENLDLKGRNSPMEINWLHAQTRFLVKTISNSRTH